MALDPLLFNTYKQYKAGTNKVMEWLVARAQEMNVLSELFPTASVAEIKGKSKLKRPVRHT